LGLLGAVFLDARGLLRRRVHEAQSRRTAAGEHDPQPEELVCQTTTNGCQHQE
jgi:hypothetical protein